MILLLLSFLATISQSAQGIPAVKRGNIFQQLLFLSNLPLNEQFYKAALRILYILSIAFIVGSHTPPLAKPPNVSIRWSARELYFATRYARQGLWKWIHGLPLPRERSLRFLFCMVSAITNPWERTIPPSPPPTDMELKTSTTR